MKINKTLWWIPIVGVFYIFVMGFKHGFGTTIENPFKLPEVVMWALMQSIAFLSSLIIVALC